MGREGGVYRSVSGGSFVDGLNIKDWVWVCWRYG
jgi:hypothetical protein